MSESNCLVSRRPIYGPTLNVAAYELQTNVAAESNGADIQDHMRTVFQMFNESGLDLVVGKSPGLVMLPPESLAENLWKILPKARVQLGYFHPLRTTDEAVRHLMDIASEGYRLAFSGNVSLECMKMLDNGSHTVIVDVTHWSPGELEKRVADLRKFNSKIAAVGVDTYDDLEFCKELNFDFYQGQFLFKPASQPKDIPVNRMNMLRLLSRLHDPNIDLAAVEQIVSQDVALTYKILQYANSAAVPLPRKVSSAGHAVRLIGLQTIKAWSSALLLSSVGKKPRELMTTALVRARMCELLAESLKTATKDSFLTAGLLSVVDALLDRTMAQALSELPLQDDIKDALIHKAGPIGQALRCAIAYEQAEWEDAQFYGLSSSLIRENYMTAIAWARQISSGLLN